MANRAANLSHLGESNRLTLYPHTYLLYVWKGFLFGTTTLENVGNMIATMKKFGMYSGFEINMIKLRLIFPRPCTIGSVEYYPTLFIFLHQLLLGNISLSLLSLISPNEGLRRLIDQVIWQLVGQQTKFINFSGKVTLIKIHPYLITCLSYVSYLSAS